MKLKMLALLGIGATLALAGCSKDDDDKKEDEKSSSIVGTWKITAQTFTTSFGGQSSTVDQYAQLDPCEKDNLIKLDANGTATNLPGATKCDPSEPNSEPAGTYVMQNNNTKMMMIDMGDTTVADVITLNTTTLSIKMSEEDQGVTYTNKLTFARQ